MDPISARMVMAAAGAGAAAEAVYVEDVFNTFLYEGDGAARTITNGIDLSGEGGMVWIKNRGSSVNHYVADTERGINKVLFPNEDFVEGSPSDVVTSFNADGFDLGSNNNTNGTAFDYASWTFRKAPGFFLSLIHI